MKHITLFLVAACLLVGRAGAQQPFELKGEINGVKNGTIYLNYMKSWDARNRDSTAIVNGEFTFRGELAGATNASLYLSPDLKSMDDPNIATFWIEEGKMTIQLTVDDFKNYRLTGSATNDEEKELEAEKADVMNKLRSLNALYKAKKDPGETAAILEQMAPLRREARAIDFRFVKRHPGSHVSPFLLIIHFSSMSLDEAREYYALLTPRIRESAMGQEVATRIEKLLNGSPGSPAALFTKAMDINGKPFDLAKLKGEKYILLDFWASWCVPCRKGNPHLKELYQKYKDDGLAVVCISDDDGTPDKWRAAVTQDGLEEFYHVLRGLKRTANGFDRSEDISELYDIHTLPTKILIDKNGIIIGRYSSGTTALDEQLASIFEK